MEPEADALLDIPLLFSPFITGSGSLPRSTIVFRDESVSRYAVVSRRSEKKEHEQMRKMSSSCEDALSYSAFFPAKDERLFKVDSSQSTFLVQMQVPVCGRINHFSL